MAVAGWPWWLWWGLFLTGNDRRGGGRGAWKLDASRSGRPHGLWPCLEGWMSRQSAVRRVFRASTRARASAVSQLSQPLEWPCSVSGRTDRSAARGVASCWRWPQGCGLGFGGGLCSFWWRCPQGAEQVKEGAQDQVSRLGIWMVVVSPRRPLGKRGEVCGCEGPPQAGVEQERPPRGGCRGREDGRKVGVCVGTSPVTRQRCGASWWGPDCLIQAGGLV